MTASLAEVQKWREAHPALLLDEAALVSAGPWPSLHVTDFVVYLQSKGADETIASFVRDLGHETAWAYGGWKKAAHGNHTGLLLLDMLNNASTVGDDAGQYAFVRRFLTDYAKANGIEVPMLGVPTRPWMKVSPPDEAP